MPVGEYANLSVRRSVREELDRLRSELGINDLNDLLILLVRTYREHTNTVSKVVELLTSVTSKLDELLSRLASSSATANTGTGTTSSGNATTIAGNQPTQQKPKRSAWEILEERGVSCVSEMKAKDPDSVMDKLAEGGAYVVSWDKDRCAILPEVYEGLLKLLPEVKTSDPERATTLLKARDSRYARVFRVLHRAGTLYYDREKGWQVDEEFIERGGGE